MGPWQVKLDMLTQPALDHRLLLELTDDLVENGAALSSARRRIAIVPVVDEADYAAEAADRGRHLVHAPLELHGVQA